MKTSESIEHLATALALARLEIETVHMSGVNPHFKSKYSKLSDFYTATNKPLAKHGLAIIQSPSLIEGKVVITTRLVHKSGQWIETSGIALKPLNDGPQAIGSAISYGRRYDYAAILGLASEEEDDGEAAHGRGNEELTRANAEIAKLRSDIARNQKEIAQIRINTPQLFNSKDEKHLARLKEKLVEEQIAISELDEVLLKINNKPVSEISTILRSYKEQNL